MGRGELRSMVLAVACGLSLAACGDGGAIVDAASAVDAPTGRDDGGLDGGEGLDAAAPPDAATPADDAGTDRDTGAGLDGGGDAWLEPSDAWLAPDAGGCGPGLHDCAGVCVPEREACGVALPDTCTTSAECGAAGECVAMQCVCTAGHRACTAGCCPVRHAATTLAGVAGTAVALDHGPDGTAFVLVQESLGASCALQLFSRPPGGALARTALTIPTHCGSSDHFDLAVRADGELFIVVGPSYAEGTAIVLHRWRVGASSSTTRMLGSAYGYGAGVGLTFDDEQTAWASWSRGRSGGLDAASISMTDVVRTYMLSASGTIDQTDVEHDPVRDAVDSFWGHRYTGSFVSGAVLLDGTTPLAPRCPADDAAFDTRGRQWAVYDTYSSILTHLCVAGGTDVEVRRATVRGGRLPNVLAATALAIDGEDIAFVSYYDSATYVAGWLASGDGTRWSRGELPVVYGIPMGETRPGVAFTAIDAAPDGRIAIVVVPEDATMGDLTLVTFE